MFPVGIDVSKNTLDLCILYDGIKGRIKPRNIQNNRHSVENILRWLRLQHCGPEDVHVVMEATGVYHERLATELHDAGFRVSLANPHRSREFARGMGIMTKTDKVDAYMLACYAFLKKSHHWEPPAPEIRYLGALLRRRDVLLGDALREENRLEKYLSTDTPAGGADRETLRHIGPEPTADVENRPPSVESEALHVRPVRKNLQ